MKIYHQNRADELRPKAERLPTVERQLTEILKELEEASKGKEDLLNGKSTLESRVFAMKNALLERDDKIAVLETDNEQLREKVEELSHDKLFELTQLQKVQLAQKDKQLSDYALEIKKIEALNEKQGQTINEIISKTNSTFRDFKQFLPTSLEAYDIQQYIKAVQKKIEMFEGYLNTIAS